MTIINKRLPVVCPDKKCPKFPFWLRRTHLLVFQLPVVLFFVLFVGHSPALAGLSNLSVDANGDSVFNVTTEKLTITFTTSDFGEENQEYQYKIELSDGREITRGPADNQKLKKNQTVVFLWEDGKVGSADERVALSPDGVYTIKVILRDANEPGTDPLDGPNTVLPTGVKTELTVEATLDTTKPKIEDVSVGYNEFSPIFDSTPIYYTLSEKCF